MCNAYSFTDPSALIFTQNDAPKLVVQVTLLNAAGRTILKQGIPMNNSNVFRVNISNLPNGIYTLWLQGDGLKRNKKNCKTDVNLY